MNTQFVADDIKRFLAMFPMLAAYAKDLDQVGALERTAADAEARIVKAKRDFDDQQVELDRLHATHLDVVEQARMRASDASVQALKILDDAKAKAEEILHAAELEAGKIVANQKHQSDNAAEVLLKVQEEIGKAKVELSQVRDQKAQAAADTQELLKRHRELRESLDALKARL